MKKVLKINNEGYFLEDLILEDEELVSDDCIETECPNGFYKPRWNGSTWVEGATHEYIDSITKPQPQEPTTKQRLQALENALLITLG